MKAVITGASRGIGRSIALELAPSASVLSLVARGVEALEQVKAEVAEVHPNVVVRCYAFDAADRSGAHQLASDILHKDGHLDVLVNCAGAALQPRPLQEVDLENWDQIIHSNLTSTVNMTKSLFPHLQASGNARIVNIASTAGLTPRPGWSAYAAAKAAVVNFSATIAEELRPYNISVFCVAPGRTATALRSLLAPDEDPSTIMQPEAVARIVSFLISDAGRYLSGQTLVVKG